jgi:hypothetical protein
VDETRANRRRREWTGGLAKSFEELDEIDLDAWLAIEPAKRLAMVFDLWDEQMSLKDPQHEPAARLQRSVGGVRPRGS